MKEKTKENQANQTEKNPKEHNTIMIEGRKITTKVRLSFKIKINVSIAAFQNTKNKNPVHSKMNRKSDKPCMQAHMNAKLIKGQIFRSKQVMQQHQTSNLEGQDMKASILKRSMFPNEQKQNKKGEVKETLVFYWNVDCLRTR